MATTAQEVFSAEVLALPPSERLRLAALILHDLTKSGTVVVEQSDVWTEEDQRDLTAFALQHASQAYPEDEDLV